jgi:hypothetical protein
MEVLEEAKLKNDDLPESFPGKIVNRIAFSFICEW